LCSFWFELLVVLRHHVVALHRVMYGIIRGDTHTKCPLCCCSSLGVMRLVADVIGLIPEASRLGDSEEEHDLSHDNPDVVSTKQVLALAFGCLSLCVHDNPANQDALWALRRNPLTMWVGYGVGQDMLLAEVRS
jgi:hypothetical protein